MDMHMRYYNMTTKQLLELRSQKNNRIRTLERRQMGYFDQQEMKKLRQQIGWIDAVLNSRIGQTELPF